MPPSPPADLPSRDVYTVSRLVGEARLLLEGSFPLLWVEGEISNLSRPSSGHWYFTLKDPAAQVRCAMFRNRNALLGFTPQNGMQVTARVRVSLYEARGEFQLIAEFLEEAGAGALRRAFDALKARLAAEGLFAAERKRPLPVLPRRIGVVTSPTGAAIRDVLTVLRRRFPAVPVVLYPVPVQGDGAAERIAAAIALAGARAECDVLIVGRGGGSLEDLWAFNEEPVARAIHASPLPVVSAVGHEIDFTIADFAADRRAPTPSAAAALVVPDRDEWLLRLAREEQRLTALVTARLRTAAERLAALGQRLERLHPGRRVQERAQRLDELEGRLLRARRQLFERRAGRLAELAARLGRHHPGQRLATLAGHHAQLARRLRQAIGRSLERGGQRLALAARALDAVSPLATLERGYAIVRRPDGAVLRAAAEAAVGARIETRLRRGRLVSRVEECHED